MKVEPPAAERVAAIAAMLPERPVGLGWPIADRAAWQAAAKEPACAAMLKHADKLRKSELPAITDELYLEFSRTGNRTHWEGVSSSRRGRLTPLIVAECVENKGRNLPALNELIKSLCAERTWVLPAHDKSLVNFNGKQIDIDLGSSALGSTLATADWLFGDKLDPAVRETMQARLKERIYEPFKAMAMGERDANWWVKGTNNWNAVCLAGVVGAALVGVESRDERAFFIASAEKYSKSFLSGFTDDGYCSEGVGYWNYGFGEYEVMAETILRATKGRVDLLVGDHVEQAARYGQRIQILPGICPAFSDCSVGSNPATRLMWCINRRWNLGLSEFAKFDRMPVAGGLQDMLLAMLDHVDPLVPPSSAAKPADPAERTWFDQGGVFIGRPTGEACRLAVAFKGGHNAESHNHNDVGSYLAVVGPEVVLVDPGSEVYTARTFSSKRYESKVLSSYGHAVPVVAGKLQRTGKAAHGEVLRTNFTPQADTIAFDIKSAYDVPELAKLQRTFVYSRAGAGTLSVTDEVAFKQPERFATTLMTFGKWQEVSPGKLRISHGAEAVDVTIEATGKIAFKAEEIHENLRTRETPTRLLVEFVEPVKDGRIAVTIAPAAKK